MYATYCRIFDRLGLRYRAVLADSGNIGGKISHEFHVLAESGEDQIVFTDNGEYAANIELAAAPAPTQTRPPPKRELEKVATPEQHTIEDVSRFLKVPTDQCIKTLIVQGGDTELVALVLRGDHELNRIKAEKLEQVAAPLTFSGTEQIRKQLNCDVGSLGPVNLNIPVIVDHSAAQLADFVCGANENGHHFTGVNWVRDLPEPVTADLRLVVAGETAPDGSGPLNTARGIEVGHIFQLGTRYSETMDATCLDENGQSVTLMMGCYGIGVSRIVAAAIEQNHDDAGIIWPAAIAPYQLALVPVNFHKSRQCEAAAMELYEQLRDRGIDVLLDDRRERPGVMFTDMELIGIPHRLVVSEKGLQKGTVEYKQRHEKNSEDIPLPEAAEFIQRRIVNPSNS
jgi:prolyl-tRNA synthetase